MQRARTLLYALCIIIISSCSPRYYFTNYSFPRPVKENAFSYKKKGFRLNSDIIDTGIIYCYSLPADYPQYIWCFRFFPEGQVLTYLFYNREKKPGLSSWFDISKFDEPGYGSPGYYHIENNTIRIEEFGIGPHFGRHGGGTFWHWYGTISKDSINMDSEHIGKSYNSGYFLRFHGRKQPYIKSGIHPKYFKPDW